MKSLLSSSTSLFFFYNGSLPPLPNGSPSSLLSPNDSPSSQRLSTTAIFLNDSFFFLPSPNSLATLNDSTSHIFHSTNNQTFHSLSPSPPTSPSTLQPHPKTSRNTIHERATPSATTHDRPPPFAPSRSTLALDPYPASTLALQPPPDIPKPRLQPRSASVGLASTFSQWRARPSPLPSLSLATLAHPSHTQPPSSTLSIAP
ncbi:hypothetical protein Fmac_014684 [Flemingia macrophylla]|uniref:Uncharacterized protein n=1 Tax=Flemingia macrophylla TaxID=520843 RepID=A0ABD1MCE6_9FABA